MAYNRDRAPKEDNGPEMIEKVVYLNRVSKTVKGGRVMKFAALVVVGDEKGKVGYGLGKAAEVPEAIRKGLEAAGIKDIRAKCLRSNNPNNVVAATFEGLKSMRGPAEVARIRGKNVDEILG